MRYGFIPCTGLEMHTNHVTKNPLKMLTWMLRGKYNRCLVIDLVTLTRVGELTYHSNTWLMPDR